MKFNPHLNTIYLDSDGVLADFDGFILKNLGKTFQHEVDDSEMWDYLVTVPHLYLQLEPTPYFMEIINTARFVCKRVKVLTAIPRKTEIAHAEEDKRTWMNQWVSPNIEVHIGPFSADKWKHAAPGDVLVDDRASNIMDWEKKGQGIGILHNYLDPEPTIKNLLALL